MDVQQENSNNLKIIETYELIKKELSEKLQQESLKMNSNIF